jgi:hypothetical protein
VIANTPDAESYPGQPGKKAPSDSELISPDEVFRSQEQPSRSLWVDFTLEAGANLVGALVGALLAIPTGLWIDRKRSAKEQRDRALVVLRALEDELAKNTQSITDYLAKPAKREQISYPSISNDAWQAAHELGLLVGLNNYDLYKSLIEVYEQLELISHLSKSLWQLFFTPAADFSFIDTRVQLLQESLRTESESAATLIRRTRNEISQALAP